MASYQTAPEELPFSYLVKAVHYRRHLVYLCTALAFLAIFTIYRMVPREYEAQALVMVGISQNILQNTQGREPDTDFYTPEESRILSEVEIIKSRDLAEDVIDDLKLAQNQAFWGNKKRPEDPQEAKQEAVSRFISRLSVAQLGRSFVLSIRFRHVNPQMAASIVNKILDRYQLQQIVQKTYTAQKTVQVLQERLNALEKKVADSAEAVETYRAAQKLDGPSADNMTHRQISQIMTDIVAAQAAVIVAKSKYESALAVRDRKESLSGIDDVYSSRIMTLMAHDEAILRQRQADLSSKYGANHPKILSVQAEIRALNGKKQEEIARIVAVLKNNLQVAQARLEALEQNAAALQTERQREREAEIKLHALQREADVNRDMYQKFLTRFKELTLLEDIQQPNARVVSMARVPTEYAGKPRLLMTLLITCLGFVLGVMLALVKEFYDQRVHDTVLLRHKAPVIGTLQVNEAKNYNGLGHIKLRLEHLLKDNQAGFHTPLVAITAAHDTSLQGNAFAALSAVFAEGKKRVLLIDALSEGQADYTLTDILAGRCNINEVVIETEDGLSRLPLKRESHAHEIFPSSDLFDNWLSGIRARFELIIALIPPVEQWPESLLIARNSQLSLISVILHQTSLPQLNAIMAQAESDDTPVEGFIVIDNEIK